jgi:hypothetical protein
MSSVPANTTTNERPSGEMSHSHGLAVTSAPMNESIGIRFRRRSSFLFVSITVT